MMMVTLSAMVPVSPVVAAERVLSRRLVRPLRARRDDARPRLEYMTLYNLRAAEPCYFVQIANMSLGSWVRHAGNAKQHN